MDSGILASVRRGEGWARWAAAIAALTACACTSSGTVGGPSNDASADATFTAPDGDALEDGATPDPTGQDTGAPGDSDGGDAGPTGNDGACPWNGEVESPACSACLRSACCGVTRACQDDPACTGLDTCVNGCSSTGGGAGGSVSDCDQACADQQTQAVRDAYQAWTSCLGTSCGANSGAGPCL